MSGLTKKRISDLEIERSELQHQLDNRPSLRDQFAMAALHAVMTEHTNVYKTYARMAYQMADAMLEARDDSTEN